MRSRSRLIGVGALLLAAACNISDSDSPDSFRSLRLSITSGADQIGLPGSLLEEPIAVQLQGDHSVRCRAITFSAPAGSGIEFDPALVHTDSAGTASTRVRLGTVLGRHTIEIDFDGNPNAPTKLTLETAEQPVITEVVPAQARSSEPITIRGRNFSSLASGNDVRIGGIRATVTVASTSELRVTVPRCLDSGSAQVVVRRGQIQSQPVALAVEGTGSRLVALKAGEALREAGDLSCLRLTPQDDSARYLIVPVNAGVEGRPTAGFLLSASSGNTPPPPPASMQSPGVVDARVAFESRLRRLESALTVIPAQARLRAQARTRVHVPELGERRQFNVIAPYGYDRVTAMVRGLGRHVVIYVDEEGYDLSPSEIEPLLRTFDDVIQPTVIDVYGNTSDIDGNGRVAVLLTPAVNRLTPPGSYGFVSGFFYGCDLLSTAECETSNEGEVLYGVMPDPRGEYGIRHPVDFIMRILPGVMAHELMHLIHFNERVLVSGLPVMETLWLAEALAHSAEDTVAGVMRNRGDAVGAREMTRENYLRASLFLARPEVTSLVATYGSGTLEERGAGWLLLKYLLVRAGPGVLGQLVHSRGMGSQNIADVTGLNWSSLVRDWAAALYAAGVNQRRLAESNFGDFDLYSAITSVNNGGYPLVARKPTSNDFTLNITLVASAASYVIINVPPGMPINVSLANHSGEPFDEGIRADIALVRLR